VNAYIVVSTPPNAEPSAQPSWIANLAIAVLRRIVPAANPDFPDDLYERVATWHVEIDSLKGEPLREVGLDAEGRVVVIGPWRDNYGVIVDCNGIFDPSQYPHVSAEQFEHEWNSFNAPTVA